MPDGATQLKNEACAAASPVERTSSSVLSIRSLSPDKDVRNTKSRKLHPELENATCGLPRVIILWLVPARAARREPAEGQCDHTRGSAVRGSRPADACRSWRRSDSFKKVALCIYSCVTIMLTCPGAPGDGRVAAIATGGCCGPPVAAGHILAPNLRLRNCKTVRCVGFFCRS